MATIKPTMSQKSICYALETRVKLTAVRETNRIELYLLHRPIKAPQLPCVVAIERSLV